LTRNPPANRLTSALRRSRAMCFSGVFDKPLH
jgi:hypothetical protein